MSSRVIRAIVVLIAGLMVAAQSAAPQTARLAGHVIRLDSGAAVRGATVQLTRTDGAENRATTADDDGHFLFSAIASGDYRVTATAPGLMRADATVARPTGNGIRVHLGAGDENDNVDLPLVPLSGIVGVVLDESGAPLEGVPVTTAQNRALAGRVVLFSGAEAGVKYRTDRDGRFRIGDLLPGDYYVLAPPPRVDLNGRDSPPTPADRSLAFLTTYFPGTDRAAGALPVRVEAGRDTDGVVFQLLTARLVRLAGTVNDASGRPVAGSRVVLIKTEDGEIRADALSMTAGDEHGVFSCSVPAGSYVLQAFTANAFGSTRVSLSPAYPDLDGVQITVHTRVRASGRLVFEGGPPPASGVGVHFIPADFLTGPAGGTAIRSTVNKDGTFRIEDLAWNGRIRVTAPAGWALKSVMLAGRDIADEAHDFQSADVDGLQVILTNRLGTISGAVTDEHGPVAAAVVVFADDADKLSSPSRFVTVARSSPTGDFRAAELLAGRYRVIALEDATTDPERLLSLKSLATPVVLGESDSVNVSLRVVRR